MIYQITKGYSLSHDQVAMDITKESGGINSGNYVRVSGAIQETMLQFQNRFHELLYNLTLKFITP